CNRVQLKEGSVSLTL
ncbi:tetracycline resistance efflux system leader peptide, partial [Enterococcus hirae]|nr:tetracycline resistance efflux system leader peptide [Enterococcus faecalis]MCZ1362939.1 tetracycline resistance efflux system leader peptide [Enterococcus faecium]MCD5017705.1 tetracycline resistance efflux system leader peptide [Enterococcus faecalis]HAP8158302.1 tetracycline resistance efflux system leader peptide [Enterococcus faecium]HAP8158305.1 tetracycline resistance efflux system leader peptide [Enterococcus faecium]